MTTTVFRPDETEIRRLWRQGIPRTEIAERYGVTLGAVQSFIQVRIAAWREEIAAEIEAQRGCTVDVRETDDNGVYRIHFIPLARVSMHVEARKEAGRMRRTSGKGWRTAA